MNTKSEFENLLTEDGHRVLIAHSSHKLHCDCWDPTSDEGNPKCHNCFGTGWYYDWYATNTRRSETSLGSKKLDLSESIKTFSAGFKYFFKTDVPVLVKDIVFEIDEESSRNDISQFAVRNVDIKKGRNKQKIYKVAFCNRISINNNLLAAGINNLDINQIKVM